MSVCPVWLPAFALLLFTGCGASEPPKLVKPTMPPPTQQSPETQPAEPPQEATEEPNSPQTAEATSASETAPPTEAAAPADGVAETPQAETTQPAEETPPLEPSVVGTETETQTEPEATADSRKKLPSTYGGNGSMREGSLQSPMEAFRAPPVENTPPVVEIPAKVRRYAEKLITRYDLDGNGTLEPVEWLQMRGDPRNDDLNGDEKLTAEELAIRIAVYGHRRFIRLMPGRRVEEPMAMADPANATAATNEASAAAEAAAALEAEREKRLRSRQFYVRSSRLPSGLPEWFVEGDTNGDAQMSMAEFSAKWSSSELDRFDTYDHDGDGIITAQECARGELVQQQLETAEAAANQATSESSR